MNLHSSELVGIVLALMQLINAYFILLVRKEVSAMEARIYEKLLSIFGPHKGTR